MLDPEVTARLEEMACQFASQPQPAFPTPPYRTPLKRW